MKKQIFIQFILLSQILLFSCISTKETTTTEIPESEETLSLTENTEAVEFAEQTETAEGESTDDAGTETVTQPEDKESAIPGSSTESKNEPAVKEEVDDSKISRNLKGTGKKTQKELYKFFMKNNKKASKRKVKRLAKYYIEEAAAEGINSDVAFVQMCHETGFLRFGNLVSEDMNNFCGLGSIDINNRGATFETERLGVRAHIQHLQAYATTEDIELHNELVDPRYEWVHKTKLVTDIFGLTKTWATDPNYGAKLDAILTRLESNGK